MKSYRVQFKQQQGKYSYPFGICIQSLKEQYLLNLQTYKALIKLQKKNVFLKVLLILYEPKSTVYFYTS